MPAFPRAHDRRRLPRLLVAVVVTLGAALSLAAVPSAPADELHHRKERVHRKIEKAAAELRHSSRALVRADRLVKAAEARVRRAEALLDRREAAAAAARLVDAQMQSQLDAANARLVRAQEALARGRRSHADQERVLRQMAAETYQGGSPGLMGLTMVLTTQEPTDLSSQLNVVENVMAKEAATLHRLDASRLLLEAQRQRVAEARREVADRRRAAAESLARTEGLEAQAAEASAQVAQALKAREKARQEAARTKRADQRRLAQLRDERNRISRLIRRQQAAERRKASKAALARQRRASQSRGPMMKPVDSYITSPYGMRLHPIYHQWRLHDGTDFGAACGTPVRAAAGGRVIGKYYNVGYGNRVIIAHGYMRGHPVATSYNHLSRYSTHVGQQVRRGEIIGFVGTTGYSTGCHLHFMVFRNGYTVNPMGWLR